MADTITNAPRIAFIPLLIAAVIGGACGFGLATLAGSGGNTRLQVEEAQAEVKRAQQAVESVELRAQQAEAHRDAILAQQAANTGDAEKAIRYLKQVSMKMAKASTKTQKDIAESAKRLAADPKLLENKAAVNDLVARFDTLIPVADSRAPGAGAAPQ